MLALVLDVVREACLPEAAASVPTKDPYLAPGEMLVAHVALTGGHGRVLAVERHRPES